MLRIILLISLIFCSSAFGEHECSHIYDAKGILVQKAKATCKASEIQWYIKSSKGLVKFVLNDPNGVDAELLQTPPLGIGIVDLDTIKLVTKHVLENTVFDIRSLHALNCNSWRSLDFSRAFNQNALIDGVLYGTSYDSGNFLWGYAAAKMGTPLATALAGAHYNSLTSKHYHREWSNKWDSAADQRAITNGHNYFYKNAGMKEQLLFVLDLLIL